MQLVLLASQAHVIAGRLLANTNSKLQHASGWMYDSTAIKSVAPHDPPPLAGQTMYRQPTGRVTVWELS